MFKIPYRVIGVFFWQGVSDTMPENHFAVVANIDGKGIVIDPTAGQFPGWSAFYGDVNMWFDQLNHYSPNKAIKAREFSTVRDAYLNVGSLFWGAPLSFQGIVLQSPTWHDRMIKNKSSFLAQQNKKFKIKAPGGLTINIPTDVYC